jgi:hypothetical protein
MQMSTQKSVTMLNKKIAFLPTADLTNADSTFAYFTIANLTIVLWTIAESGNV